MPRRTAVRDDFSALEAAIDTLGQTPLSAIADILKANLRQHLGERNSGIVIESRIDFAKLAQNLVSQLPSTFGKRFHFDAAFVFALAEDWLKPGALPAMTVPKHGGSWGFAELPLPTLDTDRVPIVRVFHFPGGDSISGIDLLSYPWLAHELAHCLLFMHSSLYPGLFMPHLERILQSFSLKGVADRGQARAVALTRIEELRKYWTPKNHQGNWAHEIAMDIIALWTTGPAYLSAFEDEIERPETDLFHLSDIHPPYHVRLLAMLKASVVLGVEDQMSQLRLLSDSSRSGYSNHLMVLSPDELISAAVDAALDVCRQLGFRDWRYFEESGGGCPPEGTHEFGTSLLLKAWRKRNQWSEADYTHWERTAISALVEQLYATQ